MAANSEGQWQRTVPRRANAPIDRPHTQQPCTGSIAKPIAMSQRAIRWARAGQVDGRAAGRGCSRGAAIPQPSCAAEVAAVIDRLDRSGAAFASVMTRGGEEVGSCNGGEARNVAEAAATASEMTERPAEVSGEAEQAGQHAADARENATGLKPRSTCS
jgi:hypothetical protein